MNHVGLRFRKKNTYKLTEIVDGLDRRSIAVNGFQVVLPGLLHVALDKADVAQVDQSSRVVAVNLVRHFRVLFCLVQLVLLKRSITLIKDEISDSERTKKKRKKKKGKKNPCITL